MKQAVKLRAQFPSGVIAMMHLPGFGPKRARRLYDELGIDSLEALRGAAERQELRGLRGFGPKAEEKLLEQLAAGYDGKPAPRFLLSRAQPIAEQIVDALRGTPGADRVEAAGSLRRSADSVKDLDVVATTTDVPAMVAALTGHPLVESVQSSGDAGARVMLHAGLKVDLKVVEPDQFGNVLQHFTGSKDHNVALRESAVKRGLHVSEYGILDDATGETTRCATEEERLRAARAAVDPARAAPGPRRARGGRGGRAPGADRARRPARRPALAHRRCPTGARTSRRWSRAPAPAATSTSRSRTTRRAHGFGNDVQPDALRAQIERVRALDAELDDFTLLIGTETNILTDGSLDYDDELLAELDWVVASVHTSFAMTEADMTARMIAAMEHPYVDQIGHPTGRKIETRPPYLIDMERVIEAAARTHTMLEINAAPDRRDLNEIHARAAAEAGVLILVELRRALGPQPGADALRDRHGAAGLADARSRSRTRARGPSWQRLRKRSRAAA